MKTAVVAGGGKLGEGRAQEALEEATGDLEGTALRCRAEVAGVQRPLFWGDPTRLKVGRPVRRISSDPVATTSCRRPELRVTLLEAYLLPQMPLWLQ